MNKLMNKDHPSICHISGFIESEDADEWFSIMLGTVPFSKFEWMPGKYLPRLTFRYSYELFGSIPVLDELIWYVETVLESTVTGVWCNKYRNGTDNTPYHQDSYSSHVFTISFGETRRFLMKPIKSENNKDTLKYDLKHGDAFYFSPDANDKYKHSIPKTTKNNDERISIVFFMSKPYCKEVQKINEVIQFEDEQELLNDIALQLSYFQI